VTAAELCAALRRELFDGDEGYASLALGKTVTMPYDQAHTVSHIAAHSGGIVYLIRYGGGILAMLPPRRTIIEDLRAQVSRRARICRFYLWLFDRPLCRSPLVGAVIGSALGTFMRFALADLRRLAWALTENNSDLDLAVRISRVIRIVPRVLLGNEYIDTLSWVAYRAGDTAEAFRLNRSLRDTKVTEELKTRCAYHLYFILRALHRHHETQELIRHGFEHYDPDFRKTLGVQRTRVLQGDDQISEANTDQSGLPWIANASPRYTRRTLAGIVVMILAPYASASALFVAIKGLAILLAIAILGLGIMQAGLWMWAWRYEKKLE